MRFRIEGWLLMGFRIEIGKWFHDVFGWHAPTKITTDGFQFYSKCVHCGKKIIKDSQGGWS
jgi:hypothetical protein